MEKASASATVSVYVNLLFSGSTAATGAPMLPRARAFSTTARWPSSADGNMGLRFMLGILRPVIPSALLPAPRRSA